MTSLTRNIPNELCFTVFMLGLLYRSVVGGLTNGILFAAAVFIGMFALWLGRLIGGGDVKLTAAAAVTVPSEAWLLFFVSVALAGGVLSLIYLILSLFVRRPAPGRRRGFLARIIKAEAWRISQRSSVPYGAAITVGAGYALLPGLTPVLSR